MDETEALLAPAELDALEERRSAGRPLEPWEVDTWVPDQIVHALDNDLILPWDWPQRLLAARMRLEPEAELWVIARTSALMVERPELVNQHYFERRHHPVAVQEALL